MGPSTALLEALIRRDRLVLLAGILVASALPWGWLFLGSGMDMTAIEMTRMAGMDGWMMQQAVWTPAYHQEPATSETIRTVLQSHEQRAQAAHPPVAD
jgi:hypothetical protein